jgi:hypothetical protein
VANTGKSRCEAHGGVCPSHDRPRHPGSAAREHTILRIGRLSRRNEHVNLRVVCPHHCSDQRIPSPHSEPQGTAGVQHPLRRPSMQVERSPNVQLRGHEAICVSRLDRASLPLQLPVWVELRGLNPVSIPGVGTRRTSARYPSDLVKCRFRPAACLQAAEPGRHRVPECGGQA